MKQMVDFEMATFEGFNLKKGFWYGRNLRGQAVASSGWTCGDYVCLYTRTERGWESSWIPFDNPVLGKEFSEFLLDQVE